MGRKGTSPISAAAAMSVLWTIVLAGFAAPVQATRTSIDVDVGFFYDRLVPYGDWREHPAWGAVWSPRGMPVDWRPYTLGHWVYTDDFGWVWDSDLEWGWACFHYGRWGWDDSFGWFWIPGSHWGPAWVAWRAGPDLGSPTQGSALGGPFIGWCPLPPTVRWQAGVGLALGDADLDDIPPWQWVFVETRFFDAPRLREHVVLVSRNVTVFRETRNVTRFENIDGRIVNNSISVRQIEESTHRPVERFRVRHVDNAAAMRLPRERDGEIALFTPQVRGGPVGVAPPQSGELERRHRAEREQLQEQQRAEQSHQQERHQAERARPGAGTEQLQQRQETERGALQSEHQRQQRLLENRQQRERGELQRPEGRPEQRGRGEIETPNADSRGREPSQRSERMPEQRGRERPR
jgi:hypothetical protein